MAAIEHLLGGSSKSIYEDDLPNLREGESRDFAVADHHLCVTAMGELGCDTGRRRYRVECLTCGEIVHEATTGASWNKRETTCDCFKLYHQIDCDAVARLNRIVAATGAKIVVSSTWRKLFDPPELHRIFSEHGLVAEIVGETPDGHKEPGLPELYGHPERMERGYEIDYWLRQHPEVEGFVILDDGSDMAMHRKWLVQTDCANGLCDEHVELAIQVLSWDGTSLPSPMEKLYPAATAATEMRGAAGNDGEDREVAMIEYRVLKTIVLGYIDPESDEQRDVLVRPGDKPIGFDGDAIFLRRRDGQWLESITVNHAIEEWLGNGSIEQLGVGPAAQPAVLIGQTIEE